jgi:hypothetical protein
VGDFHLRGGPESEAGAVDMLDPLVVSTQETHHVYAGHKHEGHK